MRLDLDPTVNETEPGQTFTTTTVDEESGVEVTGTGEGVVADGIHVRHQPTNRTTNLTAGPMVRITNTTSFEHAAVTMPIDGDVDLDREEVSIYRWNPADDEGWVSLETDVDRANRTATANVSSFSHFAVFDVDEWAEMQNATATPGWPALEQFEDLNAWPTDRSRHTPQTRPSKGSGTSSSEIFELLQGSTGWPRRTTPR